MKSCEVLVYRSNTPRGFQGLFIVWRNVKVMDNLQDSPNLIDIVHFKTDPLCEKGETKTCCRHARILSMYIVRLLQTQR